MSSKKVQLDPLGPQTSDSLLYHALDSYTTESSKHQQYEDHSLKPFEVTIPANLLVPPQNRPALLALFDRAILLWYQAGLAHHRFACLGGRTIEILTSRRDVISGTTTIELIQHFDIIGRAWLEDASPEVKCCRLKIHIPSVFYETTFRPYIETVFRQFHQALATGSRFHLKLNDDHIYSIVPVLRRLGYQVNLGGGCDSMTMTSCGHSTELTVDPECTVEKHFELSLGGGVLEKRSPSLGPTQSESKQLTQGSQQPESSSSSPPPKPQPDDFENSTLNLWEKVRAIIQQESPSTMKKSPAKKPSAKSLLAICPILTILNPQKLNCHCPHEFAWLILEPEAEEDTTFRIIEMHCTPTAISEQPQPSRQEDCLRIRKPLIKAKYPHQCTKAQLTFRRSSSMDKEVEEETLWEIVAICCHQSEGGSRGEETSASSNCCTIFNRSPICSMPRIRGRN